MWFGWFQKPLNLPESTSFRTRIAVFPQLVKPTKHLDQFQEFLRSKKKPISEHQLQDLLRKKTPISDIIMENDFHVQLVYSLGFRMSTCSCMPIYLFSSCVHLIIIASRSRCNALKSFWLTCSYAAEASSCQVPVCSPQWLWSCCLELPALMRYAILSLTQSGWQFLW
jgi:hypothetical protein